MSPDPDTVTPFGRLVRVNTLSLLIECHSGQQRWASLESSVVLN